MTNYLKYSLLLPTLYAGISSAFAGATVTSTLIPESSSTSCVESASTAAGAYVEQYKCGGGTNQQFTFAYANNKSLPSFTIQSKSSSLCLDFSTGASVTQQKCNGAVTQQWESKTNSDGSYSLQAANGSGCLNVDGGGTGNGAQMMIYTCGAYGNEMFKTTAALSGVGTAPAAPVVSAVSTLVAESSKDCVTNDSNSSGAGLEQETCSKATNQNFTFTTVSGTSNFTVKSQSSGLCLDYSSGNVLQAACSTSTSQRWKAQHNSDGSYSLLTTTGTAACLNVSGGGTNAGAAMILYQCGAWNNEMFKSAIALPPTGSSPAPSPSPSATVKPSPSPTATVKPSPSPTVTVKPSPSPTVKPSPTPSPTVKPSPSPTATVKPSPTPTVTVTPGPGTTWYIRKDGGTRYSANQTAGQCNGKYDAAYSGSGVNQNCAFNDYRWLYDDQSYQNNAWVIKGGDTVIIRNGPYRIGWDAASGTGAGYTWCLGGNNNGCFNPPIPAGTASQHTRILGENYAGCTTGGKTDRTKLTQIFGGFGVVTPLNLDGAQYVDVECLEVTRHSQCIWFGSPAYPAGCSESGPVDDYDSDGVHTDVKTHDLLLQDMWIHGHTGRGIKGPIGGTVTAERVDIAYNGAAGWDFDDGNATPMTANAKWVFNDSTIEWSGCNQEYPITHANPAISCYGQSDGGYGDGVGTPHGTGMSVSINNSQFNFNVQDGLDLGHIDTGGPYTLAITNSYAHGNGGGSFKWGGNFGSSIFTNNVAINDCDRMAYPITGTPTTFNAHLADFCRAGDAVPFDFRENSTVLFANNTIVGYEATMFDVQCWDAVGYGGNNNGCGPAVLNFFNNVVVGYDNPATYPLGGQAGGPGLFYMTDPIGTINRSNNTYFGIGHGFTCPTGYSNETCVNPDFVGQPTGNGTAFSPTELDNFNFTPASGSPLVGHGVKTTGAPALDYSGKTRPNPPSIGALE